MPLPYKRLLALEGSEAPLPFLRASLSTNVRSSQSDRGTRERGRWWGAFYKVQDWEETRET